MSKAVRGVAGFALVVVGRGNPFLTQLGLGLALGAASEYLAKKPKGARFETTVEYSGTVEPRRLIFGQCRISGMNTIPPLTSGLSNASLHQVLTAGGHEFYSIGDVYFDNVAVGTITAITGSANDGKVTTGAYANKAWVRRYTGASGQVADYILDTDLQPPGTWTSDHYGGGIPYVGLKYFLDEEVYKSGKPQVTFDAKGMICYDPRLDSSPGNDPTNASYKAWTNNNALITATYLVHPLGMGESTARIDWDMVADAADICDETVDIPPGSSTQTRYTSNVVLLAPTDYRDNILQLAGSMLGSCVESGGKWRIRAGAWEAPSFEITEDTVKGAVDVITAIPYEDRYNSVRGTFVDSAHNFQENEFPPVSDATYVSEDGETVYKDIQLPACTDVHEAQRYAILVARKSRNRRAATIVCDLSTFKVRPGDTGIVTISALGWTNQTVRCEAWKFSPTGLIQLQLREESEDDWSDPLRSDYETPSAISTPPVVYFTPEAVSSLTSQGLKNGIGLSWTAPDLMPVGAQFDVYEYTAATPFSSATKVWSGVATSVVIPKSVFTTYYYWVQVRMQSGAVGDEYPTSDDGISGAAVLIETIDMGPGAATTITTVFDAGPINVNNLA